jgi:hypothetical protein
MYTSPARSTARLRGSGRGESAARTPSICFSRVPLPANKATAEEQSGNKAEAEKDFSIAENSLRDAQKVIGNAKIAAYYHDLLGKVVEQHAALLDGENKHDEAKRLLAEFGQ